MAFKALCFVSDVSSLHSPDGTLMDVRELAGRITQFVVARSTDAILQIVVPPRNGNIVVVVGQVLL